MVFHSKEDKSKDPRWLAWGPEHKKRMEEMHETIYIVSCSWKEAKGWRSFGIQNIY